MNISLEDVVVVVRKGFDPVAQRLGLRGPTVVIKNTCFRLGYFGDEIGLEILVEFEYFFVLAIPFRMSGHDALLDGLTSPDGRVRKMYLHEALDKLRIPYEHEQKELKRLGGNYRNCEAMTSITVGLLERTWAAIQKNVDKLFPRGTRS